MGYIYIIKQGNGTSPIKRSFDGKIIYKWWMITGGQVEYCL